VELLASPASPSGPYLGRAVSFGSPKIETEFRAKIGRAQLQRTLEHETVRHGLRKCALLFHILPETWEQNRAEYTAQGLTLRVLDTHQRSSGGFSHRTKAAGNGPQALRCVAAKNQADADAFAEASAAHDDIAVGAFLGYPACCCQFFQRVWKQGIFDPVWDSAANTKGEPVRLREDQHLKTERPSRVVVLKANEEAFTLSSALRYIGLRINSHLPARRIAPPRSRSPRNGSNSPAHSSSRGWTTCSNCSGCPTNGVATRAT
jgi:hypothetical protein